jgi:2-dehydropantoate 2-reductase
MKIAIFGTGAVGGYFGGRLAQAGHDVTFIARDAHLQAIKSKGLKVNSIKGDFSIHPAQATDRPESIGTAELILCGVKSWQVAEIADQLKPLIGPDTIIITLQNGVESHKILSDAIGTKHVLPGMCQLISLVEGPGSISHKGIDPYLSIGELDCSSSQRLAEISNVFSQVEGVTLNISRDILKELWLKFMIIAPWSGLGAVTRAPVGVFRSLPETRELLQQSIQEVYSVGKAHGVDLPENAVDKTIDFIDNVPAAGTASMQRDVIAGKPSELHEQCGAVVRLGKEKGVRTPVNRYIYHSLLPLEHRARGTITF